MNAGVCSISFRGHAIEAVARAAAEAQLAGVEWGGDIHVPPGDFSAAERALDACRRFGLAVSSYGSYYRAGSDDGRWFEQVLQTAQALQAPCIRVWAGVLGSADAGPNQRRQVADDLRRCSDDAARDGIIVATEFHGQTLCDEAESAARLADEVDHPAFRLYWQPPTGPDPAVLQASLRRVGPWLANVHVFEWRLTDGRIDRRPLHEGDAVWPDLLQLAAEAPVTQPRWALLEFMHDDRLETLPEAAAVLQRWLG